MRHLSRGMIVAFFMALTFALFFQAGEVFCEDVGIEIKMTPNVLNLQMKGRVVTVHMNLAYDEVDGRSVTLNNFEIKSWKKDDQGNFVAKFSWDEIRAGEFVIGEYNMFTLEGMTKGGEPFMGTQDIMVIDMPKKQ